MTTKYRVARFPIFLIVPFSVSFFSFFRDTVNGYRFSSVIISENEHAPTIPRIEETIRDSGYLFLFLFSFFFPCYFSCRWISMWSAINCGHERGENVRAMGWKLEWRVPLFLLPSSSAFLNASQCYSWRWQIHRCCGRINRSSIQDHDLSTIPYTLRQLENLPLIRCKCY